MARLTENRKRALTQLVDARCKFLQEGRGKKVTKQMWKKMDVDARENALLTVIKDPDDRRFDDYLEADWNKLPGWAQRDMLTEGWWDYVSTGLDVLGMIPGLGVVPDLINAGGNQLAAYLTDDPDKKRKYNTARNLSLAASVPGLGLAAGGGKLFSKGLAGGAKFLGAGSDIAKHADKVAKISNMPKTMNFLKTLKYGGYAADPTKAIMNLTKSPKLASALGGQIGIPYLGTKFLTKLDKHATDFDSGENTYLQQAGMGGKGIFSDLYKKIKDTDWSPKPIANKTDNTEVDIDRLPYDIGPKY